MNDRYASILHLPHPVSSKHPPMARADRAAQFSAFAALTGYEDVVAETARETDARCELGEQVQAELNARLQALIERLPEQPTVRLRCFVPDERKEGGSYINVEGQLRSVDLTARLLYLNDHRIIPLDDILELTAL